MNDRTMRVRARLAERLERIADEEGMSLDELVDHALRVYAEQFPVDDDEEELDEEE